MAIPSRTRPSPRRWANSFRNCPSCAATRWRPIMLDDALAFTLAARYSDRCFGTIDNSDPDLPDLPGLRRLSGGRCARPLSDGRQLEPVGGHRQSQQRQIFPLPSLPAADLRDGDSLCAIRIALAAAADRRRMRRRRSPPSRVSDAWIRAAARVLRRRGGYFTLHNDGKR